MIGMFITVLIHELGHLVCGAMTGYRFLSFTVFGYSLVRVKGRIKLIRTGRFVYGQCLMYPRRTDADPRMLIVGGAAMNLTAAMILIADLIFFGGPCDGLWGQLKMLFSLELAVLNLTGFFGNLICGSAASDGATLKEVLSDPDNVLCYNHIMLISKEYVMGVMPQELPREAYLYPARSNGSGLAEELKMLLTPEGKEKRKGSG